MSNFKPKQSTLNALINHGECNITNLAQLTNYSRVTISKEIESLLNSNLVRKNGTKYTLNDNCSFAVLKMHNNHAEMVCFNSNGKLLKRSRAELLFSLPYKDNITFFSTSIQRTFSSVLNNAENPFSCIVCDEEINVSNIISRKFTVREVRQNLISNYLSHEYQDKSVLYLNNEDSFSALCFNGSCLGTSYSIDKSAANKLKTCFNIFKPHIVLLEGKFDEKISDLCEKEKIDFKFLSSSKELYIDEKQLILDCLCKL